MATITPITALRGPARDPADVLSPAEAAAMWHVTVKTLGEWAREGKVPSFRNPGPHGHRRYRRSEMLALMYPGGRP